MREEIISRMVEMIKERMNCDVKVQDVSKNNGTVSKAIVIREDGEHIVPTIYIDEMVSMIEADDWSISDAVEKVVEMYINNKKPRDISDIVSNLSKETILEHVQYYLVNKKMNKARLEEAPYNEFLDLAVMYKTILSRTEEGTAGMVIHNKLCEVYGISQEELEIAAKRNMEKETFKIANMSEIFETAGVTIIRKDEAPMYVCSNESGNGGAVIMLNTKYFRELAEKLENDLYILPSSIHEVIVIPIISTGDLETLRGMVKFMNETEVAVEEVLSDTVYKYIRKEDQITIA